MVNYCILSNSQMSDVIFDILKNTLLNCITLTGVNIFDGINFHYLHEAGGDGARWAMGSIKYLTYLIFKYKFLINVSAMGTTIHYYFL